MIRNINNRQLHIENPTPETGFNNFMNQYGNCLNSNPVKSLESVLSNVFSKMCFYSEILSVLQFKWN